MQIGRPRKFDPSIPAHIDQRRIPKGAYWDARDRVWYTKPHNKRANIANAKATLADLHRELERLGAEKVRTIGVVLDRFHESKDFAGLSAGTQKNYEQMRKTVRTYQTSHGALSDMAMADVKTWMLQLVLDDIAKEYPTKANHVARYLGRVFAWGVQRNACTHNPARGLAHAKERRRHRMPTSTALDRVVAFVRERAALKAHTLGSLSTWLPYLVDIAYICRLRGIEVLTLTDDQILDEGLRTNRRKGSRDNIVKWSPRLRAIVDAALATRRATWARKKMPVPMRADQRSIIVSERGTPLTRSGLDSAWARLVEAAIEAGVITEAEVFTPHGLKHRGITDTRGTRGTKQQASGHKTEHMLDVYDHEVPIVEPAGER